MIVLSVDPREKELEDVNDNRNSETPETVGLTQEKGDDMNEEDLDEADEDEMDEGQQ